MVIHDLNCVLVKTESEAKIVTGKTKYSRSKYGKVARVSLSLLY